MCSLLTPIWHNNIKSAVNSDTYRNIKLWHKAITPVNCAVWYWVYFSRVQEILWINTGLSWLSVIFLYLVWYNIEENVANFINVSQNWKIRSCKVSSDDFFSMHKICQNTHKGILFPTPTIIAHLAWEFLVCHDAEPFF